MKRFSTFIKFLYEETRVGTITDPNQNVHPIVRRAIEIARAKGSQDVYIPDSKDMTKMKLVGKINPNESPADFAERLRSEWEKNRGNPEYEGWQGGVRRLPGHRAPDVSQEYVSQLSKFDAQNRDPRFDPSTGESLASFEASRKKDEDYEKALAAWWDQDGGSKDKDVQSWRTTGYERYAAEREKNRNLDREYLKANPGREEKAEEQRKAREQAQKEQDARIEDMRKRKEQADRERDARQEEMRKRQEERSRALARPASGRQEPA